MGLGRVFSFRRRSTSPKPIGIEPSKHQQRRHEKEEHRRERTIARDAESEAHHRQREAEEELAAREDSPEQHARYGPISRATSDLANAPRIDVSSLQPTDEGRAIIFRARLHTLRFKSHALAFVLLRQKGVSVQGVLTANEDVTDHMLRWTRHLHVESVLLVSGLVQRPPAPVTGTTIHTLELKITTLHLISAPTTQLPFDVFHAEKAPRDVNVLDLDYNSRDSEELQSPGDTTPPSLPTPASGSGISSFESQQRFSRLSTLPVISDRTRLAHRVMDLRSGTSQAVFRVQAGVTRLFREYLDDRGFVELHTPKLQGGATESGASVFGLNYFNRPAFLAQSPQLAKQMAISADFERVYEIGPVFRAENSNTHRHLTEFTGLDLEMTFERDYHEVMDMIDGLIKHILTGIHKRNAKEIDTVREHFPSQPFVWLEKTPILTFSEGIKMLRAAGWTDDSEEEDISTAGERLLGQLVKEKYGTDYYILDKFPVNARPFYTMPDSENPRFTNAFDIFLRGQEILSGSQRIHDATQLESNMRARGVRPQVMEEYMDGFRWGAPPHAGCGFGLERIVMLLLNLGDVRHASMFPRDPKSLPALPELGEVLRHPEANTLEPTWARHRAEAHDDELPPLEKLIANYGDAPNTAWLDRRYSIWRHAATGAAIGYSKVGKHVIVIGDPLCDRSQLARVAGAFLQWVTRDLKLQPLWLLASEHLERVLGEQYGWRTLTCVAEARVEPSAVSATDPQGPVARKIRHAEREGVKIDDYALGEELTQALRDEVDVRIRDWLHGRKGKQVHLTDVDAWRDFAHRRFFIGRDKDGKVCGMVVLAQLSVRHGFQIKWALDFPGAPGGTIEYMVMHAIQAAQGMGAKSVTFGATPSPEFHVGHNIAGVKARALEQTYATLTRTLNLLGKSEFKEKLGAVQDAEYIAYPPRGMGPSAVRAIMKFFGAHDDEEHPTEEKSKPDPHKRRSLLQRSIDVVRSGSHSRSASLDVTLERSRDNGESRTQSGLATPQSGLATPQSGLATPQSGLATPQSELPQSPASERVVV